jgi:serine/threonine protein kinase
LNIEYCKIKTDSFVLLLAQQFVDSPLADALGDGFKSLAGTYQLDKIPASKSADVYTFTYGDGKSSSVFYFKQYHYRSLWDFLKHTFRPGRAKRTMQAAEMLRANGFDAPPIIAMGYRRKGPFCLGNFLLTREVENAPNFYSYFNQHFAAEFSDAVLKTKRDFVKALGKLVGRLHSKNISHGDLRLGNILVRPKTTGWDFFLLDNERTVQYARLPKRSRLKNLVQVNMFESLALTRTDRLRFFDAYLSENLALAPTWKTWAAKIHRKTRHRLLKPKYLSRTPNPTC